MANSGSFNTDSYQGRYLEFSWSVKSQSVANNQTTISWTLTGAGNASSSWYNAGNFKVIIEGTTVYYSSTRIRLYDGTVVASGEFTMSHNNEGQKSFSAYAEAGIYNYEVNCTGEGSWSLPQIARAATINTWGSAGVNKSVSIDGSSSISYTSYSSSFYYRLRVSIPNVVAVKYINNYKNEQALTFTSSEKSLIYSHMTTSKTITLGAVIETYTNSSMTTKIGESSELLATAYLTSPEPTISSITYRDTNSSIAAITQDNSLIVRNKSTLEFTLNNIVAQKQATLTKATATINGVVKSINLSGSSISSTTLNFGILNVSSDINASIVITDSRGFTVTKNVAISVLDYINPYATIILQRENNYYSNTNLTVHASYSSLDEKNSINIQYQYKKVTDSGYGSLTTINNNTNYTLNLDNNYQWNVKIIITDILGTIVNYILTVDRGIPQVFFDRKLRSMSVNSFPKYENSIESQGLQIDDKIYIGSQVIYDSGSLSSQGTQIVLGSYDYGLIDNLFTGVTIPDDYEKGYRISAQVSTNGGNYASVMINNIETYRLNTWSNQTYRKIVSSPYFRQSDIILETTYNYSKPGTNLKLKNTFTAGSGVAYFWNVTIHAYLIKKSTNTVITISDDDEETPSPAT